MGVRKSDANADIVESDVSRAAADDAGVKKTNSLANAYAPGT